MNDLFAWGWTDLISRAGGPLSFRLVLQPAVAIFFAIRSGIKDANEGRPLFLWAVLFNRSHRLFLLRQGWKDVGMLFLVAVVLDAIYQLIVLRWVHPWQTLLVAAVLAILPYLVVRGLTNRLTRRRQFRQLRRER